MSFSFFSPVDLQCIDCSIHYCDTREIRNHKFWERKLWEKESVNCAT